MASRGDSLTARLRRLIRSCSISEIIFPSFTSAAEASCEPVFTPTI